jgi:hypothetical protein
VKQAAKIVLWSLLATTIWCALNWAAFRLYEHRTYGTIHTETDLSLTIEQGQRFSLEVPDRGASVGDQWSATVDQPSALAPVENRKVMGGLADRLFGPQVGGGAGSRYFIYSAAKPGLVTVRLYNCFQGGCDQPGDTISRGVTWQITVR